MLAQGTNCGIVYLLDLGGRRVSQKLDHGDASCQTERITFSRSQNELLEFFRCKSSGDDLRLRRWPINGNAPVDPPLPPLDGDIVKVWYGSSGNPYVVTVTPQETYLVELASSRTARARWPLAYYDGAPIDVSPDEHLLAVGFGPDGIRLYARAFWPFQLIPVKSTAKGIGSDSAPASGNRKTKDTPPGTDY